MQSVVTSKVFLSSHEHGTIELLVERWQDRLFIECHDCESLLNHLRAPNEPILMTSANRGHSHSTYIRGVIIPREGAYFDLMDACGVVVADVIRLDDYETSRKILMLINWEAAYQ